MEKSGADLQQLVVVLGSHRSGTSATARALNTMGVSLGDKLIPGGAMNAKGFFEDSDILEFNEEILTFLGLSWASLALLDQSSAKRLVDAGFDDRAAALLERKMSGHTLYGIKEPRITALIGFWSSVFNGTGRSVKYVVTLRNPASVARSLQAAHALVPRHGYYLWLIYMIAAIEYASATPAAIIEYDTLIARPSYAVGSVADRLGLQANADMLTDFAEQFVDPQLRSSQFTPDQLRSASDCPEIVAIAFEALQVLHQDQSHERWQWAKAQADLWRAGLDDQRELLNSLENAFTPRPIIEPPQSLLRRSRSWFKRLTA